MYYQRQFDNSVGCYSLGEEEMKRYRIEGGGDWNEGTVKILILEVLGINADYIKVIDSNFLLKAYFNCVLHKKAKYFFNIIRTFSNKKQSFSLTMQYGAVPCECLQKDQEGSKKHQADNSTSQLNTMCIDLTSDSVVIEDDDDNVDDQGTNIQILPSDILEKIFLDIPIKMNLRLVCKSFKNVIDHSTQLMQNQWLVMQNALDIDPQTINHAYQKLEIHYMGHKELNWMSKYQRKDRIKEIKITSGERCPSFMLYIISNFDSLEVLNLDLDEFYEEKFYMRDNMRLIPNENSKLETLHIGYYKTEQFNVLEMFADIPTIKNLYIHEYDKLIFPEDVKWKLEKLQFPNMDTDEGFNEIGEIKFKNLLTNQKTTLKELRIHDNLNYVNFVIINLPKLERLTLSMDTEIFINANESRFRNLNLTHLTFNYYDVDHYLSLKRLLGHYIGIQKFCLMSNISYFESPIDIQFKELKFFNLTHLMLKSETTFFMLNAKLPNLKFLMMSNQFEPDNDEKFDYTEIPEENLKHVQKASLKLFKVAEILTVIWKCPQLTCLNIDVKEWETEDMTFIGQINSIIAAAPQIKQLGICEWLLKKQKMTIKTMKNKVTNKNVCLKVYEKFSLMIDEDWKQEIPDRLDLWNNENY